MTFIGKVVWVFVVLSFGLIPLPVSAQELDTCHQGELPLFSTAKNFGDPKIPLACWRAKRQGDQAGIWFKTYFDVTPAGLAEHIEIDGVDPECARAPVEKMISEWKFECSELGRKRMRIISTISSPGISIE